MKNLLSILGLLFVLLCQENVSAQKVTFSYDAAGNRIASKTIVLRAAAEEEEEEEETPTSYSEVLAEREIRIYPNPTKGLIRIELSNMQGEETALVQLYDLSGKRLYVEENVRSETEMDITGEPDGVYLLQIRIGEEYRTEWKVIKE